MRRAGVVAVTLALAVTVLPTAGCTGGDGAGGGTDGPTPTPTPSAELRGRSVEETVDTPSLANNILGDPAERDIMVHLPPSYDTSDARYPVVFYLAGADEPVGRLRGYTSMMLDAMLAEGMRELIVVEVDGASSIGNTFYTNSPVTGDAEDALVVDLVAHVDATYRTVPEAAARGLSGFSMGGSGTVNVGLRHADVFSALYAASPGLLRPEDGLAEFLRSNRAWACYGAAFAPDPDAPYPHHLPIDPDVPLEDQDPVAVAAWEAGYGALEQKVADHLAGPDRLTAVRISYGTRDGYPWIPEGSAYLVELLLDRGVPATERPFDGPHALDADFATDYVAFFSEHLATG